MDVSSGEVMDLFTIICTTCKSRLKVRDPAAVGQILACPKCGGMVMVKPPPAYVDAADQKSDVPTATEMEGPALGLDQTFDSGAFDAVEELLSDAPPKMQSPAAAKMPSASAPARPSATPPSSATPPPMAPKPRFVGGPPPANKAAGSAPPKASAPSVSPRPAAAAKPKPATASDSKSFAPPPPAEMNTTASPPAAPMDRPGGHRQHWLLIAGSVMLGMILVLGVAAVMPFFREPVDRQPAVASVASSVPTASNMASSAATESPSASVATDSATESTTPEPRTAEASSTVAKTTGPAPAATDSGDPLGLTKEPSATEAPIKPSADPLAKFDRIIGDGATDPLAKPTARSAEPSSAAPPPDATPPRPLAPRPPPREIDIARRLADPLQAIDTPGTPLADFVQLISDLSTIPITLELPFAPTTADSPVAVHLASTTVSNALAEGLKSVRLEYVVEDDQLLVRRVEPNPIRPFSQDIKDLAGTDPQQMTELAELLKAVVEPALWGGGVGAGSIEVDAGKSLLIITHRRAVQFEVLAALDKLRASRTPPLKPKLDPSLSKLESRPTQARPRLEKPISLNYGQPTRLLTILERLGHAGGVRIVVDWRDVASAGWNPAGEATLVVSNQPLAAALDALLNPLDLTWRIIDGQTLQVVTPARLAEQGELELYKVDSLAGDEAAAEALVGKIRPALGEARFRDAGGNGEIRYEPESKCLFAWLPQPKQRELEALLSKWRAEGGK
jgi:DNA-directed RNA polymerase subunit RPC12/RpoP